MLKITKVKLAGDETLEMQAVSDSGEQHTFEVIVQDIPMLVQMLLAAKQQKERNDSKKEGHEPTLMINYVEGWQVFGLPDDFPEGIGLHFQCGGGFDFAFAITDEGKSDHTPGAFMSDLTNLIQAMEQDKKEMKSGF